MNIKILCVGKIKETYLMELINDYLKRISKYHKIEVVELKDYPDYEGPKESDVYPPALNQYQNFSVWLIENFTEDELRSVLDQLKNTTSSAKLTGIAAGIREAHKKAKKTVRVGEIIKTVEAALEKYPEHVGNKIQREEIRKKESDARAAYIKEKRKHQTPINLQRE